MKKININTLPEEDRLVFIKQFTKKKFQNNFDECYDLILEAMKIKGYQGYKIKFINDIKYVNAYVVITV
jgi:hypothetical protein